MSPMYEEIEHLCPQVSLQPVESGSLFVCHGSQCTDQGRVSGWHPMITGGSPRTGIATLAQLSVLPSFSFKAYDTARDVDISQTSPALPGYPLLITFPALSSPFEEVLQVRGAHFW